MSFNNIRLTQPTPEMIRRARERAKLSQKKAAKLLKCAPRAFERWEQGKGAPMHPAIYQTFIKITQRASQRRNPATVALVVDKTQEQSAT